MIPVEDRFILRQMSAVRQEVRQNSRQEVRQRVQNKADTRVTKQMGTPVLRHPQERCWLAVRQGVRQKVRQEVRQKWDKPMLKHPRGRSRLLL